MTFGNFKHGVVARTDEIARLRHAGPDDVVNHQYARRTQDRFPIEDVTLGLNFRMAAVDVDEINMIKETRGVHNGERIVGWQFDQLQTVRQIVLRYMAA